MDGLAKFAALLYKSRRCRENQRLEWLQKAKVQAEGFATEDYPEFSNGLFFGDVGNALYDLGKLEEAIASYEQATQI